MKNRKNPREKKELDYDKQRRTHWDNQKAARKAIPASKRAARQIIRKRSSELIALSLSDSELAPTATELTKMEKTNRYQKHWGGESLREHVQHVQRASKRP